MATRIELFLYRERVIDCCCFGNFLSPEYNLMTDKEIVLNRALDNSVKILRIESPAFIECYRKYREWLLKAFVNPSVSFISCYKSELSFCRREKGKAKIFRSVYGRGSRYALFFAQTFFYFAQETMKYDYLSPQDDFSNTELKMKYGAMCMLDLFGYTNLDHQEMSFLKSRLQKWTKDIIVNKEKEEQELEKNIEATLLNMVD